ncbi:MAG: ankyrin repeat domain-containing protein [Burkholderiales bacterium]
MRIFAAFLLLGLGFTAWAQPQQVSAAARLFTAIEQGKELVAEGILLQGKPDLDARNPSGETVLHCAVEKGMKELVRAMVKAGASLRARSGSGETVLHLAAMHVDPELVRFLLEAGADPKARNDDGESPLQWAALSGNVGAGRLLLERGADPNLADLKGNRPLHAAADSGNMDMVRLILSRTTDTKAKNREGLTAEDVANERSRPEIAQLLSKAVAQPAGAGGGNVRTVDIDDQPKQRF